MKNYLDLDMIFSVSKLKIITYCVLTKFSDKNKLNSFIFENSRCMQMVPEPPPRWSTGCAAMSARGPNRSGQVLGPQRSS